MVESISVYLSKHWFSIPKLDSEVPPPIWLKDGNHALQSLSVLPDEDAVYVLKDGLLIEDKNACA